MPETWYALVTLAFIVFAVTEGRNFGIGIVMKGIARTREERTRVMHSLGPLWSWDEVWLVAATLTVFLAFPRILAAALPGYYLAVFVLLWCLVLRGMALEVGDHFAQPLWREFWHTAFALSSLALAACFGAAFGNVVRGVPLDAAGRMFMPLFTDFAPRGEVGIFDWYTILVACFTVALLAAHGALYVALRTSGEIYDRAMRRARGFASAAFLLLVVASAATDVVRPGFFAALTGRLAGWLAILVLVGGVVAMTLGMVSGKERLAHRGSTAMIVGLLAGAAASMYPVMLRSTLDARWSMTAQQGAAGSYGLKAALFWWPVAVALSLAYAWLVARRYRGKVGVEEK